MTIIEQQIKDLYHKFSVYSSFVYLNTSEMIDEIVSIINSVKNEVTVIDKDTIIITADVVPGHQTTSTGLIIMQEQPIRLFFIRTLKHYECNEFCRLVINIKNPVLKYTIMSHVVKLKARTDDVSFRYDTIDLSTHPTKRCSLENTIGLCRSVTSLHHSSTYEQRGYFIGELDNYTSKYCIRTGADRKCIMESVVYLGDRLTRDITILVDCMFNLDSLSIVLDSISPVSNVVLNVYLINIGERLLSNRLILNTKDYGQVLKGLTINYILGGFKDRFFNRSEKTQSLLYIECTERNRHLFRDNENVKVNIYSYNHYDTFFMYYNDNGYLLSYEESPELYQLSPVNDDTIAVDNLAIKVNHEVGGMNLFKDYLTKNPNVKCY
jgi:hypothetical protein